MLIVKLAFRNILRNRRRSLLTLLSMGGGFFLLCLTLSMSEGSYANIINIFTQDHTGHVQIHKGNYLERPSLYKTINNADEIISQLEQQPSVLGIAPRIYGPSLAYGKNKTVPAQVVGIDPRREAKTTRLVNKVTAGHYLTNQVNKSGYFPAMIGFSLAKNLQLKIGDELVLISQGIDGSIANDIFEIVAVVGDASSYERMSVYISLSAMREFLSMQGDNNKVHELAIILSNQSEARSFAMKTQSALDNKSLRVAPWQVVESSFYNSMQADKKGSYVSMGIIIFIVSIGVLNTILMGTLERTREFGVLKAVGTRPLSVFNLIMLESFVLAIFSCLIGLTLALPVCYWLASSGISMPEPIDMGGITFDTMLGEVSWFVVLLPTIVVISSTLIVSFIPAIRAAKISPLKALQAV
ncbi:ABC transporter permease [Colwellia psychrerythraea]|uniref:MacB-like periplasmic core domain containing protein n=1 Tax=Colwellia psychrerythraea TaxID=28229 RepID=A0A099L2S1_COLPS|nr:ABC transporter permease [Colwellia psychrerythraea]KGJ96755.1 MacB-like periplasmic core domain containing protein [Colwellia psychrerythraea]